MTLTQWLTHNPYTLQKLAQALSGITASYQEEPVYPYRLKRLMEGHIDPLGYEVKALLELTEDDVDCYNEPKS